MRAPRSIYEEHAKINSEEKFINMKNIARNTLAYLGDITLSQYVGSKKIKVGHVHNKGGKLLFDFLACCFTGDFATANTLLPRKIWLFDAIFEDNGTMQVGTFVDYGTQGLLSPARKSDSTENTSSVCYSFNIPYDNISAIDNFEHTYVGLYTEHETNVENYLACFSLSALERSSFLNTALVVDWELQVVNGKTDYEEVTPTE